MKSQLHDLTLAVSRQVFQDGVTVQQIMGLEDFKRLVKNCKVLKIEEVDILVAIAKGKRMSDAKKKKAA
jgi:hypothetical protein